MSLPPASHLTNRAVPAVVSVVLFVAAGLKIHDRIANQVTGSASIGGGWLPLLMAECEIVLGAWLLSGRGRRLARQVTIVTFGLFAAYNLHLLSIGQTRCHCLGVVKASPLPMLLFDAAAIAALIWWRPDGDAEQPSAIEGSRSVMPAGALALVIGTAIFGAGLAVKQFSKSEQVSVVDGPVHDFGEVPPNQLLTHAFGVRNSLRVPVEILSLKSSCGCTTTDDLAGQTILPGEELAIPVSLRSGIRDDESIYGDVTVYYQPVASGDPSYVVLRVTAVVKADYHINPCLLDFGAVAPGQSVTRTVSLEPRRMADARMTAAEIAGNAFRCELVTGSEREVRVTYSPWPTLRSGPDDTTLTIRTNSPNVPKIYVRVLAHRVLPAEVTPLSIVIDSLSSGIVRREITVTAGREFEIAAIESDDARVTGRPKGSGNGRSQTVEVTVQDTPNTQVNSSLHLTLRFNDMTSQEVYRVSLPIHRLQPRTKE